MENTPSVCLICLHTGTTMYSMREYKLKEAYEHLTGHPLFEVNNLEHTLCVECTQRLVNFEKFRDKSLRGRALMMELVQQHKVISIHHIGSLQPLLSPLTVEIEPCNFSDTMPIVQAAVKTELELKWDEDKTEAAVTLPMSLVNIDDIKEHQFGIEKADEENKLDLEIDSIKVENNKTDTKENVWINTQSNIFDEIRNIDNADSEQVDNQIRKKCDFSTPSETVDPLTVVRRHCSGVDTGVRSITTSRTHTKARVKKSFVCDICQKAFKYKSLLTEHALCHSGITSYTCKICQQLFRSKRKFASHMRIHRGKKFFVCEICQIKYTSKIYLERHMTKHINGEGTYLCELCAYKCSKKNRLSEHMLTHTGEKRFACNLCDYKATQKHNLITHMNRHTSEKVISCELCDYKCNQKINLDFHMKKHNAEKPFECNICEYTSYYRSSMFKHKKIHLGEKPHTCIICQYKCIEKNRLVRHMITHTGQKPLSCEMCTYRCTSKCQLKIHMRKHTGEKPFGCAFCPYTCTRKSNLVLHIRTHTGERPYACELCSYTSSQRTSLVTHMRTHSGNKQRRVSGRKSRGEEDT